MSKKKADHTSHAATAALQVLNDHEIDYQLVEYDADAHSARGFALDAAKKLNLPPDSIFKTLVATITGTASSATHDAPVIAVVPANCTLNLKRLAKAASGKRAHMLPRDKAQLLTGYVAGGISPLGTKTPLPVYCDERALNHETMLVSAGKRGMSVRISALDLVDLTDGTFVDIADAR